MPPYPLKAIIVMPAYNAARTLRTTLEKLPREYREIILCDDASTDDTVGVSRALGLTTIAHERNCGYGANQKTLYDAALRREPDVIVMVHPDDQYDTAAVPAMVERVAAGASLVLGARMASALKNGMPVWKYTGNRLLTALQNITFRSALSEFHSGLRAYDARLFREMPYASFSDEFVFDSEIIAWCMANGRRVEEVPAECHYTPEVSSVGFRESVRYGLGTLRVLLRYFFGGYREK